MPTVSDQVLLKEMESTSPSTGGGEGQR